MSSNKNQRVKRKQLIMIRIEAARIIQRAFRNTTQCVICLQLVQRKCGCCHSFHDNCREKWIGMGKSTCPTCRATLPLTLQHKKYYFIYSGKLLKELKQAIEIWDPNYFDEEEFKRWDRKIALGNYYIDIIANNSIFPTPKILSIHKKCLDKMDMVISGTNQLIMDLTDYLEDVQELNINI